jgi:hypothetical protein
MGSGQSDRVLQMAGTEFGVRQLTYYSARSTDTSTCPECRYCPKRYCISVQFQRVEIVEIYEKDSYQKSPSLHCSCDRGGQGPFASGRQGDFNLRSSFTAL